MRKRIIIMAQVTEVIIWNDHRDTLNHHKCDTLEQWHYDNIIHVLKAVLEMVIIMVLPSPDVLWMTSCEAENITDMIMQSTFAILCIVSFMYPFALYSWTILQIFIALRDKSDASIFFCVHMVLSYYVVSALPEESGTCELLFLRQYVSLGSSESTVDERYL